MKVSRNYTISGRVQGVGYRYFVCRAATRLGIDGCVRNLPGGDVEVVACGTEEQLAALLAELRSGPQLARVRGVVEAPAAWPAHRTGFNIA